MYAGSADDLRAWLTERVAHYLDSTPDMVDADVPLAEYGIDSVYVVSVFGQIEERYGLSLDPSLAWDYPTIDALAGHLVELLGESR